MGASEFKIANISKQPFHFFAIITKNIWQKEKYLIKFKANFVKFKDLRSNDECL